MIRLGSGWRDLACILLVANSAALAAGQRLAFDTHEQRFSRSALSLQNANLNFGTTALGQSKSLTATLINNSSSNIVVMRAVVTDGDFKVGSPSLPLTLPGGQSIPVSVTFTPQAGGVHAGHLIITGDSSNQTAVASLSGTAASALQLSVNPSTINFGTVSVGSSQTRSMSLTNSGGSSLNVSQATVTGTGFRVSGLTLPLSLSPGQSVSCSVSFSPQSGGSSSGTISLNVGSSVPTSVQTFGRRKPAGTPVAVALSGTGTTSGSLAVAPASIGFGNVSMGTSQTSSGTITNSGGSSVTISQATVTGNGFSLNGLALPLVLSPGQNTAFTVSFVPQSSGLATGSLAIVSNGSNPAFSLSLSGTGVSAGTLAASPLSLSFGTVQVGSSNSLSGTLTNSGGSSVTVSQATVTGSPFSLSGVSLPLTLTAGQSATFRVSFAPLSSGTLTGNLAIVSNASNPTLNIALSGAAPTAGALAVTPTSLSFGSLPTGSSKTLPVTVTNSGGSSVTISQVATSSASYSTTGITPPVTLSGGQSFSFNVAFTPTASGTTNGTLSVSSNAPSPTLSVPLSGAGNTPGSLAVNPPAINFGNVVVGTSQSQTSTLSASSAPVTVASAGVSGSEFSISGLSFPLTIAAGGTASFTITFTPQASGAAAANISFASNATNTSAVESVSGSGTAALQHSVALSWNPSTSTVAGYNVYRGSVSGGPYARINPAPDAAANYSDSTVQGGQTYYYVVTSVDSSGTESGYSNQVRAVIPSP